jgi:Na+-translocating ferredoxin:NAD+ oxidoreductase RNF subunit RnfB
MNPILLATIIVGVIGLIAGLGLSISSVVFAVKTDERIEKLREEMPGANCGACGYSGCDGYAEALAKGECKPGLCAPGGVEVNEKLGEILGVGVTMASPLKAVVLCNGTSDKVYKKSLYAGVETCKAANMFFAGDLACSYGCLGYGDCMRACMYGAIEVKNGRAVVDKNKCTACSACVRACPKNIIKLLPADIKEVVVCCNKDKGAKTHRVCEVGCIACMKCVKSCEFDAVKVENNLAVIDHDKCTACGECVKNCPVNCIVIK